MDYKLIGKLKIEQLQNCFSKIVTNEVILRNDRAEHIITRRGEEFFLNYAPLFASIVENPDYILQDNKPNTVLMCKKIQDKNKSINLVVRLAVEDDNPNYKNSIITAVAEKDKRFKQRLRNMGIIFQKLD
ncbi:MAG: hypothetical protein IJV92_02750 [Phascolarctobacterium sp.]|nr:hypothetical protein [Phascolarctobacterium sp.]